MPSDLTSDPWLLAAVVLLGLVIIASLIRWTLARKHHASAHNEPTIADHAPPAWHHPASRHLSPLARYKAVRGMQAVCLILLIVGIYLLAHEIYLIEKGLKPSAIPDPAILILVFFSLFKYIDTSRKLKELGPTK